MSIQDLQAMIERNAPENLPYTSDGQMQLTPEEKDYFSRLVSQHAYAAGGAVSKDLTPEQLAYLRKYFAENGATRQTQFGNGDSGPTYNTETNFATPTGGGKYQAIGNGEFAQDLGNNQYAFYDSNGNYTTTKSISPDKLTQMMPYIVGAGLGGIALFGGAAGAAGAAEGAGLTELGIPGSAVGSGEVAATGLLEPGAAVGAAGAGTEGGGLLSKAALDGTTAFGANSVPGALEVGSYAGTAIPSAVDLGSAGGVLSTGSTLSGLGDKVVSAVTNPANLIKYGPAVLAVLGAVSGTSQPTQTGTGSSGPKDTRSLQNWDWDKLRAEARARGVPLSQLLAGDWSSLTQGAYNKPEVKLASGGALSMLAQGSGSGRDDQIDAKLSDGEYVIDAETTAMIGDGSAKEGAKRLDEMRQNIRKHKGKALAKGKISPNAKSPLQYIKESA